MKSTAAKGAALLSTLWVPGYTEALALLENAGATSVDFEANEPEPPPEPLWLGRKLRQWPDSRIQGQGEGQ